MGTTTKIIIVFLILINTILASLWVINGNIFFHTDIARDFLLIEDIAINKPLTLIGPRSGAIPGLFHGPLWLYLNLPSFLLGGGNPLFVGWFWVVLYLISLGIIYFVGRRLFDQQVGALSAVLLSVTTVLNVRTLFNPYGAMIIAPLFFYFFLQYLNNGSRKNLLITFFILGCIIQFQMAFGVPITILTFLYLFYKCFKRKKFIDLLYTLIIIIPLSSHILFEIRNHFIQTKSVLSYLSGSENHGKLDLNLYKLITLRIKEMLLDGWGGISQNNPYVSLLILLVTTFSLWRFHVQKNGHKKIRALLVYFYLGFWAFALLFKGPLWNYYYLPFIPLLVLFLVSLKNNLPSWIFYTLFVLIYLVNTQNILYDISTYNTDPNKQDVSTWKFNEEVARRVFNDSDNEFGYFIFTPDLYGYSPRYAMNYLQRKNPQKKVFPYVKKKRTYLLIAPPPIYGRDPNSIWYQKNTNSKLWKDNDIKIKRNPDSAISFENGFVIEKYNLNDEEITEEPNPYLIKDIFFR